CSTISCPKGRPDGRSREEPLRTSRACGANSTRRAALYGRRWERTVSPLPATRDKVAERQPVDSSSDRRRVVVLGANSFSGQDFVDLLLDDPRWDVHGLSRSPERSAAFLRYRRRAGPLSCHYHQLDLNRDMPAILDLLDGLRPEAIVNFAAQSEVAPS